MIWTSIDTWIVITGALSGAACALVGVFLLLRRMSMMGDAISHAVLPGLALAFLFTGTRASFSMFIGAAIVGVLTALFTQWVHRFGEVEQSASMGVVFTTLFAIGLILIVQAADAVDLDPGCVLYGSIELTPLDTMHLLGMELPRAVVVNASVLLLNLLLVLLFFKELKISSFDPALSTSLGIHAGLMHYLLMIMVAVTTVAAFESVGSILVIAMLIVPPATALLLSHRLQMVLLLSVLLSVLTAWTGHVSAITLPLLWGFEDTSTAGMMAVISGVFFMLALLGSPQQGIVAKLINQAQLHIQILSEDVLGLLYRMEEQGGLTGMNPQVMCQTLQTSRTGFMLANRRLKKHKWLSASQGLYELTDAGRSKAAGLIRSHRLWEAYLHHVLELRPDHVHTTAEKLEHITSSELQDRLADRLSSPEKDPHGDRIPDKNMK